MSNLSSAVLWQRTARARKRNTRGSLGARLLTTLLYALEDRDLKRGIASLCLGGGEAVAVAVER